MIEAIKTGPGTVSAEGITVSHRAPTMELCRALVRAGHEDGPMVVRYPDGRVLITVPSIVEAAKWTIEENSSHGPTFVKWKPFDRPEIHDRQERSHQECHETV